MNIDTVKVVDISDRRRHTRCLGIEGHSHNLFDPIQCPNNATYLIKRRLHYNELKGRERAFPHLYCGCGQTYDKERDCGCNHVYICACDEHLEDAKKNIMIPVSYK